jgi:hypothetical protein
LRTKLNAQLFSVLSSIRRQAAFHY